MYLGQARDHPAQGDIIDGLLIHEHQDGRLTTRIIRAVVLSHDCEIQLNQKKRSKHALVVEMRPPEDAKEGGLWALIRRGEPWSTFYLPAGPDHQEGFLDFNRIHRVERVALYAAIDEERKLASLTDEAREQVIYAFMSFLLHEELASPDNPNVPEDESG